jgi:hypothetical protein
MLPMLASQRQSIAGTALTFGPELVDERAGSGPGISRIQLLSQHLTSSADQVVEIERAVRGEQLVATS